MAKDKKIAVTAIEKTMKENFLNNISIVEWNGLEIEVKNTISFDAMLKFVQSAVNFCFVDDSGEYIPQVRDFAIKNNIIGYYTNISLSDVIGKRYDFIYKTDIIDTIMSHINQNQFSEIKKAVYEKANMAASAGIVQIQNGINKLIGEVDKVQESMIEAMEDISPDLPEKMVALIDQMREKMSDAK